MEEKTSTTTTTPVPAFDAEAPPHPPQKPQTEKIFDEFPTFIGSPQAAASSTMVGDLTQYELDSQFSIYKVGDDQDENRDDEKKKEKRDPIPTQPILDPNDPNTYVIEPTKDNSVNRGFEVDLEFDLIAEPELGSRTSNDSSQKPEAALYDHGTKPVCDSSETVSGDDSLADLLKHEHTNLLDETCDFLDMSASIISQNDTLSLSENVDFITLSPQSAAAASNLESAKTEIPTGNSSGAANSSSTSSTSNKSAEVTVVSLTDMLDDSSDAGNRPQSMEQDLNAKMEAMVAVKSPFQELHQQQHQQQEEEGGQVSQTYQPVSSADNDEDSFSKILKSGSMDSELAAAGTQPAARKTDDLDDRADDREVECFSSNYFASIPATIPEEEVLMNNDEVSTSFSTFTPIYGANIANEATLQRQPPERVTISDADDDDDDDNLPDAEKRTKQEEVSSTEKEDSKPTMAEAKTVEMRPEFVQEFVIDRETIQRFESEDAKPESSSIIESFLPPPQSTQFATHSTTAQQSSVPQLSTFALPPGVPKSQQQDVLHKIDTFDSATSASTAATVSLDTNIEHDNSKQPPPQQQQTIGDLSFNQPTDRTDTVMAEDLLVESPNQRITGATSGDFVAKSDVVAHGGGGGDAIGSITATFTAEPRSQRRPPPPPPPPRRSPSPPPPPPPASSSSEQISTDIAATAAIFDEQQQSQPQQNLQQQQQQLQDHVAFDEQQQHTGIVKSTTDQLYTSSAQVQSPAAVSHLLRDEKKEEPPAHSIASQLEEQAEDDEHDDHRNPHDKTAAAAAAAQDKKATTAFAAVVNEVEKKANVADEIEKMVDRRGEYDQNLPPNATFGLLREEEKQQTSITTTQAEQQFSSPLVVEVAKKEQVDEAAAAAAAAAAVVVVEEEEEEEPNRENTRNSSSDDSAKKTTLAPRITSLSSSSSTSSSTTTMGRKNQYRRDNSSEEIENSGPDQIKEYIQTVLGPNVAELVYWRDPKNTGIVFAIGFVILLSLSIFSVISVVAYSLLFTLLGTLSFRIYKNVLQAVQKTDQGHPFKEYLDIEITPSQDRIHEIVDSLVSHCTCFVNRLRSVLLVEDIVDSLKYLLIFWALTYIGAWFNGLTLVILAYLAAFSLPKVYEQNKAQIDQYLELASGKITEVTDKIPFLKKPAAPAVEKKDE